MSDQSHVPHLHEEPDAWHRHSEEEGMPQDEHGSTVNPTMLGIVFVVMVFGVAFVILLLTAYFNSYTYTFKAVKQEGVPTTSRQGYVQHLNESQQKLGSYGWLDRQAGTVHLPIDDAFDRVIADYEGTDAN